MRGEKGCEALERALDELGWRPAELVVARGFAPRLLGMTVRDPVGRGGLPLVMAFPSCRSVHTCFMRYPLDIACVDVRGRVLALYEGVRPWRMVSCPGAVAVLERASLLEADGGRVSWCRVQDEAPRACAGAAPQGALGDGAWGSTLADLQRWRTVPPCRNF